MGTVQIIVSAMLVLAQVLVYGIHLRNQQVIPKDFKMFCTLVVKQRLVRVNIRKAVTSGLARVLALLACFAGTGLAGRTGISAAAIKNRSFG